MLAFSCDKTVQQSCESVACTEIFMSVSVKVMDRDGNPVALDSFKITRLPDNEDLTREYDDHAWNAFGQYGTYPIANDADDSRLPRHTDITLKFQGYIDGNEVVNADYVITFDCCHISLVSGDMELVVD